MASILLIDDQADVRDVLTDILVGFGHTVRSVPNVRLGLAACRSEAFDLVITDIIMPGAIGYDAIVEIRNTFPGMRIIAMSGGGQGDADGYLGVARQLGVDATLAKPFGPDELQEAVTRLLQ